MPAPYGPRQIEHPQGTTVLVLGILSVVICGVLGPFAWAKGNTALAEIDRNPIAYSNRSYVQIGKILGIVGTCFLLFQILMYGAAFLAVAVADSGAT
jgi:hypothetical protein